jgi:hypothetical protein
MAILSTDIKYYHSGGVGNSDPNASLGGARSNTELTDDNLHNLFDLVPAQEALDGKINYRCIYGRQEHATLTLYGAKVFISQDSTGTGDEIDIGLATQGKNGTASTIADEDTAPSPTVTFSHPTSYATGLALGDFAPDDFFGIFERRTVSAGAAATTPSEFKITIQGETDA